MKLKNEEMKSIDGGAFTATMLNAITKAVNTVYEFGRQVGSTLRRLINGKYCSIN